MKEYFRKLIAEGKTSKAIQELLELEQLKDEEELYQELVIQSSRLKRYEQEKHLGISREGTQDISINKINHALIRIIDSFPEAIYLDEEKWGRAKLAIRTSRLKIILGSGTIIILLGLFIVHSNFNSNSIEGNNNSSFNNLGEIKELNVINIEPNVIDSINRGKGELLKEYVTPVMQNFEQVHLDYLQTFKKVITLIQTLEDPYIIDSPLKRELEWDSIFSYSSRIKLITLYETNKSPEIKGLIDSIEDYLTLTIEYKSGKKLSEYPNLTQLLKKEHFLSPSSNNIRWTLIDKIFNGGGPFPLLFDKDVDKKTIIKAKKESSIELVELMLKKLQEKYVLVFKEYLKLREELT